MNLHALLAQLPVNTLSQCNLPEFLLGSFRRKSISFYNGLTDEETIVYWFQSRSFSIDLRLCSAQHTPITERQGWIGTTVWDSQKQELSWQIAQAYQLHIQWPEPAKLYAVGNCILKFAPSGAYVEDWRQQSNHGMLLGLRLSHIQHMDSGQSWPLDGGLIIAGQHMAYAQARLPHTQAQLSGFTHLAEAVPSCCDAVLESYEVSVALEGQSIRYSTQSSRLGQSIDLDNFAYSDTGQIMQYKNIAGEAYCFYFVQDFYLPDYDFVRASTCSAEGQLWLQAESAHLLRHAQVIH